MEFLKSFCYLVFCAGCFVCIYFLFTFMADNWSEKYKEEVAKEEETLHSESIEKFNYLKDNVYLVTGKEESTYSLQETGLQHGYFLIVVDPSERIYRLRVPETLYHLTPPGEKLNVKEGKDKSYVLSNDTESVYYKEKYPIE